jgi:hypothetical protein
MMSIRSILSGRSEFSRPPIHHMARRLKMTLLQASKWQTACGGRDEGELACFNLGGRDAHSRCPLVLKEGTHMSTGYIIG